VILLDEPFSSLDSGLRAQVRCDVRNLLRSLEVTALFVTHDQEEAFELGDEVAVMVGGRVEQQATPGQLYDCPCTRIVAEFIGDANILSGVAEGSFAETAFDEVPLLGESVGRVDLVVRPEQIAISLGDDGAVLDLEFYGHHTTYQVRLDSGEVLTVRALGGPTLTTGDRVELRYDGPPVASFAPPSTGTIDLAATVPLEADVEHIALQALGRS
jgi:iron(III) transport system ATP-binding protein